MVAVLAVPFLLGLSLDFVFVLDLCILAAVHLALVLLGLYRMEDLS
jgi:hypothetical protein